MGRPVLTIVTDAYSNGFVMGYSLTWEGGTYSLRNLMLNVIADKVEWCKKFGIIITKEQWDSKQMPAVIVSDMGSEYQSATFSQITELGVTLINLPPLRPELKSIVERSFQLLQDSVKPFLMDHGYVNKDSGKRLAPDYRKGACLTLEDYEKVIIHAILSQADMATGTEYEKLAVKNRASIDNLIGMVSQVALNNILLIVIDECQNVCRNKGGVNLIASMTQLINASGVSICLVGLPETEMFFGQEMQLARRSVGLSYSALPCNDYFIQFCETLFSYQYVAYPSKLTPELAELLYECTGGIVAILVSVIMEAQQIAILTGKEELSRETILMAYKERLKNVQDFVKVIPKKRSQTSAAKKEVHIQKEVHDDEPDMDIQAATVIKQSRECGEDVIKLLKERGFFVEEVAV